MWENLRALSLPQVLSRKLARHAAGFVSTHGMRTYQVGV